MGRLSKGITLGSRPFLFHSPIIFKIIIRKERVMEAYVESKKTVEVKVQRTGWKRWGIPALKFFAFGGWMLCIMLFVAIYIAVHLITK